MQRLIGLKDRFDIAFACDTDHDRHGIVTPQRRPAAAESLPRGRDRLPVPQPAAVARATRRSARRWSAARMIDRVAARLGRTLYEVPVGFKWFVDGLLDGSLGFGGEESAGASFLRRDGTVWTTDKDGIVPALLAAEITARTGRDPGELYRELDARARRAGRPIASTRRRRRSRRSSSAQLSPRAGRRDASSPASRSSSVLDQRARQRRADRRHQGDRRRAAGSPRARPAPRTSTRSTPRASAAPSTCSAS